MEIPCEWMFATKFASNCERDGVVHSARTSMLDNFSEELSRKPNPLILSQKYCHTNGRQIAVQIGGVLLYTWGVSLSSRFGSQEATAEQMGGVCCCANRKCTAEFITKLCRLGGFPNIAQFLPSRTFSTPAIAKNLLYVDLGAVLGSLPGQGVAASLPLPHGRARRQGQRQEKQKGARMMTMESQIGEDKSQKIGELC